MIVVDASVLASTLIDDGAVGRRLRERLVDEDLAAPEVVDLEIASTLRKATRQGTMDEGRATRALVDLATMAVQRHTHVALLDRIWQLREHVTPYDAAYVALAEELGATLVTADARLARSPGPRCAVELVSRG